MPVSAAQKKASAKYLGNLDEVRIRMPKGKKATIQAHASANGESVNSFIVRAIAETMERDGGAGPQESAGEPSEARAVYLPPETLEAVQQAAEAAGETVPDFIARAVETQAQRDTLSRRMEGGEPNE